MAAGQFNMLNEVQGFLNNVRNKTAAKGKKVEQAIKKCGLLLQTTSQKMVPVNYGVLKASAFTSFSGSGWDTKVQIGYTAYYALFVHEMVEMKLAGKPRPHGRGRYWDPQGKAQAKFLETPYRTLRPQFLKIIKDAAK
jgi:hypothetical protein